LGVDDGGVELGLGSMDSRAFPDQVEQGGAGARGVGGVELDDPCLSEGGAGRFEQVGGRPVVVDDEP
jgi:hypothetical protein